MNIIFVTGTDGWCWEKTSHEIAYQIPEHHFEFIGKNGLEQKICEFLEGEIEVDLFVFRGYANLFLDSSSAKLIERRFVSWFCTGGTRTESKMNETYPIAKRGAAMIVQNRTAFHCASMMGGLPVYLMPNGISCDTFFPPEKILDSPTIGMAANTAGDRGMLKGLDIVERACEKEKFTIRKVGNGTAKIPGHAMALWYRSLFAYAQPSLAEGCSNSVMEAMATGLPCLLLEHVGYHGEVCKCGICHDDGQVVFVKRSAKDVAEKINILRENPYILNRIRRNAREFAMQHSWKRIARTFKQILESVAK